MALSPNPDEQYVAPVLCITEEKTSYRLLTFLFLTTVADPEI
jgi:hypothetical protein